MKSYLSLIILFLFTMQLSAQNRETEIIVIGNIHQPVPNYNSDTLLRILEKLKPDVILHEMDSSFFTEDFKFKFPSKENEQIASEKYLRIHPNTKLRPFEFEGRNEYRIKKGMRPTDNLTIRLLDSLYENKLLTVQESDIIETYHSLTNELEIIASKSAKDFNNSETDSIAEKRQFYQYQKFAEITNNRDEFARHFLKITDGNKISYRDGFQRWVNFWDLRNQTMARNIMKIVNDETGKRLVVLTGFLHRYYILSELNKLTKGRNIVIKEFYEYD